jgi:hypothetical protein
MQNFVVIDDFYSKENFGLMCNFQRTCNMKGLQVPQNIYYPSRLDAYPTWESNSFNKEEIEYKITEKTILEKTQFKINKLQSFFRKVLTSELLKSPYKDRKESLIHQDPDNCDWAGVIYFDSFSIDDDTRLYSYADQIKPDVIVGSKPNRCILFKSHLFHSAGIDWNKDSRTVQVFFLEVNKNV